MRGCNDVPTGAKWRGASSSDQRKEEEPPPRFLGFPRPLQWNLDSLQPLAHPRTPGKNPWCLSLPKSLGQIAQLALSYTAPPRGPQRQALVAGVQAGTPATGLRRWGASGVPDDRSSSL